MTTIPTLTPPELEALKTRIGDREVVVSVSGGKDSCATALYLKTLGIPYRSIFANTHWEADETYDYLKNVLPQYIGPIHWVEPPLGMQDLILKKGMFPSRLIRFCTQQLKYEPIKAFFEAELDRGVECVNAIGIRAQESEARSKETEWESCFEAAETWRPILRWTEDQVIAILREYNVPPNPLYLRGATRVGCWPCIFANKQDLRLIAKQTPERISQIERLEARVAAAARIRAQAKGEELENNPTFFQARERVKGEEKRSGRSVPIAEVIDWAKTDRRTGKGNDQYLLLEKAPPSCMKWGLCE